jgi:tetratricopeptide (TPR) repeat protein
MIDSWLKRYPHNPLVLSLKVQEALRASGGKADLAMVPLLEAYASARPVDPLPHKLMAAFYLSGGDPAQGPEAAVEHLEYLDAREQHSAGYAVELARRYAAVGDFDKAARKAARATQIAPYNPGHREFAAKVALQSKDYATAERHIRALIAIEPDREIHKRRLDALLKTKP